MGPKLQYGTFLHYQLSANLTHTLPWVPHPSGGPLGSFQAQIGTYTELFYLESEIKWATVCFKQVEKSWDWTVWCSHLWCSSGLQYFEWKQFTGYLTGYTCLDHRATSTSEPSTNFAPKYFQANDGYNFSEFGKTLIQPCESFLMIQRTIHYMILRNKSKNICMSLILC